MQLLDRLFPSRITAREAEAKRKRLLYALSVGVSFILKQALDTICAAAGYSKDLRYQTALAAQNKQLGSVYVTLEAAFKESYPVEYKEAQAAGARMKLQVN